MQKKMIWAMAVLAVALLVLSAWILPQLLQHQEYTTLIPCVLDGETDRPISDAQVVALETGKVYSTDETGHTPPIRIPVSQDAHFTSILPKPWSEASLIAYCKGYTPYAVFYLQVYPGKTRSGPNLYLFPAQRADQSPLSVIEGPDHVWIEELVRKYQP